MRDAERAQAMQAVVEAAIAGSGSASYLVGALFRSGPGHPANAAARDPDTARHWLESCVGKAGCPRSVFAALAELELAERHLMRAMVWAQLATLAEREVLTRMRERGGRVPDPPRQAYKAALLRRIYDALPPDQRDAAIDTELNAWLAKHGADLQRIIDQEVDALSNPDRNTTLEFATSPKRYIAPGPIATEGYYFLRVPPGSDRPDGLLLVDGLPTPKDAKALRRIATTMRFKPYVAVDGETARYVLAPIAFDDGRFSLRNEESPAGGDD